MDTEQKGWRKFDCEELEDIINDVRSGVKDSAHIHSFVRREIERTLQEQREEMVKRVEGIKTITGNAEAKIGADAFKRAVLGVIKSNQI